MEKRIISPSPHIHSGDSVAKNMYGVLIALIPAFLVSFYCFGLGALIVTGLSVASCVLFEYLIQRFLLKRQPTVSDGSAILTGVLLAFNLPSNMPPWIVIIGALVAIGVGKMTFGGLGNNIFNPALVGRVFLFVSFPAQMTSWPTAGAFPMTYLDAETGATSLSVLFFKGASPITFLYFHQLIFYNTGITNIFVVNLALGYMCSSLFFIACYIAGVALLHKSWYKKRLRR